jgi:type IV pili sensor histidine kinase/response regulator
MCNKLLMVVLSMLLLNGCAQHAANDFRQINQDKKLRETLPPLTSVNATELDVLDQSVPISRYAVVSPAPTVAQQDILKIMVTVTMPKPIMTVGDAIHHLLKPSGYTLARFDAQGSDVIQLLRLPLPEVHRKLGPMPLDEALLTLASPAFRLHADPVHRLIAYDLKNDYQQEFAP